MVAAGERSTDSGRTLHRQPLVEANAWQLLWLVVRRREMASIIKKDRPSMISERLGDIDSRFLLEHVFETMPTGLYTVDPEGTITSWNRAMEDISGYPAREMIGQPCTTMRFTSCRGGGPGKCVNYPRGPGCPLFENDAILGRRCQLLRADGRTVTVLKNARVMRGDDGSVIGGIESVTDISGMLALEREVDLLRKEVTGHARFQRFVGRHPSMRKLYEMVDLAANSTSSVLIQGDTGTGKELVAHAIHQASGRRSGPFIRVSCAALSESLLESELFGHVRGAFTGATANRKGRFEAANGGTLFLDEIGDISPSIQTKLLRALQERQIERVGENRTIDVDIRVISATNQNLEAMSEVGDFRQDLYYRLCVIPLYVPPLCERVSDVPLLVEHFISSLNRSLGRDVEGVSSTALEHLMAYRWPGNIRELENAVEYACVLSRGQTLELEHFPPTITRGAAPRRARGRARVASTPASPESIIAALQSSGGNRQLAAEELGVSRVTLWKWMKSFDIDFPTSRSAVETNA